MGAGLWQYLAGQWTGAEQGEVTLPFAEKQRRPSEQQFRCFPNVTGRHKRKTTAIITWETLNDSHSVTEGQLSTFEVFSGLGVGLSTNIQQALLAEELLPGCLGHSNRASLRAGHIGSNSSLGDGS